MFALIACQIGQGDDLKGEREQMGVNDNDKRVSFVIRKVYVEARTHLLHAAFV